VRASIERTRRIWRFPGAVSAAVDSRAPIAYSTNHARTEHCRWASGNSPSHQHEGPCCMPYHWDLTPEVPSRGQELLQQPPGPFTTAGTSMGRGTERLHDGPVYGHSEKIRAATRISRTHAAIQRRADASGTYFQFIDGAAGWCAPCGTRVSGQRVCHSAKFTEADVILDIGAHVGAFTRAACGVGRTRAGRGTTGSQRAVPAVQRR